MKNEPALTVAGLTALGSALVSVLVAFGLHLSADQKASIIGAVIVVAPLVAGFITRRRVTPVPKP